MKKLIKNGTILLVISVIGMVVTIGVELYHHQEYLTPPKTHTPQEIAAESPFPININTADENELRTIPKLTKEQAQSIIEYRTEHGDFTELEELIKVKHIGKKSYERILPYISIE